jgi:Protein of unknown function (DUF2802)
MMINEIFTLYALIISTGLLLAAASIAILRFQNKTLESKEFWNSPTGAVLKVDDANLMTARERLLEKRLAGLQKIVDELSQRDSAQPMPATSRDLPFENAVRMAQQGASIEDLRRSCGLNLGEAQLLRRMHAGASVNSAAS